MKKILLVLIAFFISFNLSSCTNEPDRIWYDTVDDAIHHGLLDMGAFEIRRLSVDEETLFLYKLNDADAIGLASVTTSDKGYSWYQGISPFSSPFIQLNYKTESNNVIRLTIGKASDETSKEIILEGKSRKYNLDVVNGYYIGIDIEPFY
ncbi:hypothetical protein RB620_09035 [Paenibacillus sp. LHD-117]|uniref:hypothetical protein n=1 Tax=Paenibacillus sp. LHD-117 TaxID=3071412 RepID=UPI0027DEBECC|nr:hypothetical protein [Paenibacillus sp. LHD-117]MDQ6419575.1 hypothetical protein [Paenibacillus sp. LHD-117]